MADHAAAILKVAGLTKRFGGLTAVRDFSAKLQRGRITSLIGPNGAGKSTLFQLLCGSLRPDSGVVRFQGADITGLPPDRIARLGIGRTFQDVRTLRQLTALTNVMVAARDNPHEDILSALVRRKSILRTERRLQERAMEALRFVGLEDKAALAAGTLSYGEQKLVALAQLLMGEAELLMLDEPAAGVRETLVKEIGVLLRRLSTQGRTILLIEHNLALVKSVSDHVIVLDAGSTVAEGTPAEVLADARVLQAYLGRSAA